MSVLIDISHPAHVHFYRPLAEALLEHGIQVHIVARPKDVTLELLMASGLPFEMLPMMAPGSGHLSAAAELLRRSWVLRRRIHHLGIRVLLTRNPSGAIAAFTTPATSVFDTIDGRVVGAHYWAARPFADIITSSIHDPESHGRNNRRYPGLREQMSLHPDRFTPDPAVRRKYLLDNEDYCVVRFSAHDASHDRNIRGLSSESREAILERLDQFGPVIMSVERNGLHLRRGPFESVAVSPNDFHHLLAFATLFVGDSQSVAAEAAVLGVPCLRLSGFSGRLFYLNYLEANGLMQNFLPGQESALIEAICDILSNAHEVRRRHVCRTKVLRREEGDIAAWYLALIKECLEVN